MAAQQGERGGVEVAEAIVEGQHHWAWWQRRLSLHGSDDVRKVFNDMDRSHGIERAVAKGVRKTIEVAEHVGSGAPDAIRPFEMPGETETCPFIEDLPGLVALAQMDVLEIHPWGSTIRNLETPDRVTFDLDPDEGLPWPRVTEAAVDVREIHVAVVALHLFR